METTQQQRQMFTCSEPGCNAKLDADNLFLPEMSELRKLKAERLNVEEAFIVPEDVPFYALCENHRYDDDTYTLAKSIASAEQYQQRRNSGGGGSRRPKKKFYRSESQVVVTEAEANELVACLMCRNQIPRNEAQAPSWMGCNILQAHMHHYDGELVGVKKTFAELSKIGYVTSADMLKSGEDGFSICEGCVPAVIEDLKQKARDFGISEEEIAEKIQAWSVINMILGVRRKEEGKNSR